MKAQYLHLTELLEGSKQFIIPIFRRTYSWQECHCRQLWDDLSASALLQTLKNQKLGLLCDSAALREFSSKDEDLNYVRWPSVDNLLMICCWSILQHRPTTQNQADNGQ